MMEKVIETNLIMEGLLKEQQENNESFMKKMLMDLGVVIDGTFTFGTGITAFLPTVRELLKGGSPVLTEQDIVLLYITAMWILLKRNEDKIGRALTIIREKGLTGLLAKVYDFLESTEDIIIKMADEVGYTASRLTDITAFTFMTFPVLDVLLGLIRDQTITVDNPGGYLKSILISIGILSVKNGFNTIIKRIRNRYGNVEETTNFKLPILKESKNDDLYNVMTTSIVRDIMTSIKKTITTSEEKTIYLPEEINGELTYNGTDVSVEITITRNPDLKEEFLVEAFYSPEDDVIELGLELNPLMEPNSYQNVYSFLIEYVRHELEHYDQNIKGELPASDDGLGNLEYYLQPHEIPAQVKGLDLRATKTKQSYDEVVKKSVEHSKQRYGLSDTEASELYNKLIDGIEHQLSNSLLKEGDGMVGVKKEKVILDTADIKVVAPMDKRTFCYYGNNTTWCDAKRDYIWDRCNQGTCYIILDKRDIKSPKNIILNSSKIPLLIQKNDSLSAFNSKSDWIQVKSILSKYPELADLFEVTFTDADRLRYDMEIPPEELSELSKTNSLSKTIYKIIQGELVPDDLEEYLGDDVERIEDYRSWQQFREGVEIHGDGITLKIEEAIFIEDYLGLADNENYFLSMAMSDNSGYGHEEEQDPDELNYMSCWYGSAYDKLMELFLSTGLIKEKKECGAWGDGEMQELLETYFGDDWVHASWDILTEIGYGIGESRVKEVREVLDDVRLLPFEEGNHGYYDMFISWEQLLYLVSKYNIDTLTGIKTSEALFLDADLESVWYDNYDWGQNTEETVSSLMSAFVTKVSKKIENSDYKKNMDRFLEIMKNLGFAKKWHFGNDKWQLTVSNDIGYPAGPADIVEKSIVTIESFDAESNEVTLIVQVPKGRKKHIITLDELPEFVVSDELFVDDGVDKGRS